MKGRDGPPRDVRVLVDVRVIVSVSMSVLLVWACDRACVIERMLAVMGI